MPLVEISRSDLSKLELVRKRRRANDRMWRRLRKRKRERAASPSNLLEESEIMQGECYVARRQINAGGTCFPRGSVIPDEVARGLRNFQSLIDTRAPRVSSDVRFRG